MGNYLCCCNCLKKTDNEVILEKNKNQALSSNIDSNLKNNKRLPQYAHNNFPQASAKQLNLADANKGKDHKNLPKSHMHKIEESKKKITSSQNNEEFACPDSGTRQRFKDVKISNKIMIKKDNQDENLLQNDKKAPLKNHDLETIEKTKSAKTDKSSALSNANKKPPFLPLRGKVIMAIGETGTGKSSFLNLLGNILENTEIQNLKTYFKLKKFPKLSEKVSTIVHENIKTMHQSEIIHTNSISIVEIRKPSTNDFYTLIDTPGILSEINGSPDEQFIKIINELLSIVNKIDCLVFLEKSDIEKCSRSNKNTISRLEDIFNEKIGKVVPVFTFYPGSLIFNKDFLPFNEKMHCNKGFKLNNLMFGYGDEERISKANQLNKTYKILRAKIDKIMTVVDGLN